MNILITATTYPRYRDDTIPGFVHSLGTNLTKQQGVSEVHALVPHDPSAARYETMDGVHIHRYRYWWPASGETITYGGGVGKIKKTPVYALKLGMLLLAQFFATWRVTRKYKIDVINAHWLIPMGFIGVIVSKLTRRPIVISVHGGDVFGLRNGIFARVKRWTLARADKVITNSSATLNVVQELYPRVDYTVLPMGIDEQAALPKQRPYAKDETLQLLFVGRLSEEKGVQYLLQALQVLTQKHSRLVRLTIVGGGSYEAQLKTITQDLRLEEVVDFSGWVSHADFPKLFARADVFVGPSIILKNGWQEAFGLVFAESLLLNTPVIATKTGGIKDIVIDGKNGFLVSPEHADELAAAIERFIDDPSLVTSMVEGARTDVQARFSWDVIAKKYAQQLAAVVKNKTDLFGSV